MLSVCEGNPLMTDEFPSQMASDAKGVSNDMASSWTSKRVLPEGAKSHRFPNRITPWCGSVFYWCNLRVNGLSQRDRVNKRRHYTHCRLLVLCEGNSTVTDEFPSKRPVTRGVDVFFDLLLNKQLSKQSWGWLFETPSRSLWRHCNEIVGRSDEPTSAPMLYDKVISRCISCDFYNNSPLSVKTVLPGTLWAIYYDFLISVCGILVLHRKANCVSQLSKIIQYNVGQ